MDKITQGFIFTASGERREARRIEYGSGSEVQQRVRGSAPGCSTWREVKGARAGQFTAAPFAHLSDPAERVWLTNVSPSDVLRNAHRIYDFMAEGGLPIDSYTREMAFQKASTALGIDYDVLYNAWLNQVPATVTV